MPPPRFRTERLTLPLLLLALSTLFLCSVDKGYFYSPGSHNFNSMANLVVVENLSPDHGFRLFRERFTRPGGDPTYDMYGRFPVGGYALIKLAILPFGNDLSAKILAARMLMLLLFSGAALLAFHALARITSRRWVALAATLAAFSSWYMLFYSDMVCTEGSVDLFAVMLVFHGMVVFVQEGRFRQLLAKTGVALLLGWHVYAFLLPFIILGLAREAVRAWKDGTAVWPRVRSTGAALLRSRYAALGLAALLFGMAVLGFNFANEYAASGGERAVTELPSFQSMLRRTGVAQDFAPSGWWLRFLQQQFFRVCVAFVPSVLSDWGIGLLESFLTVRLSASGLSGPASSVFLLALLMVIGASAAVVCLARPLLAPRQRLLLAALALSGFCWALPMRHSTAYAYHAHEALYYVGVPLAFYSLLLLYVHDRWGHRPVVGIAAAALLVFVVSTFRMEQRWPRDPRVAELQRTAMAELGTIRDTTRGKAVLVLGSVEPKRFRRLFVWKYYLAGSVLVRSLDVEAAARAADFIVAPDRVESDALLTPGNERMFLYDSAGIDDLFELYRAAYPQAVSGEPAARSYFDVYLNDDALTFVRDHCVRGDARDGSSVSVNPEDLPGTRPGRGSGNLESWLNRRPGRFEGKCIAVLPLSDLKGREVEIPASR